MWTYRDCAMIVVLMLASSPAIASTPLYRCTALDARTFGDDGRLKPTAERDVIFEAMRAGFLVDTASGVVRIGERSIWRWVVVQAGNASNDHVLAPRADARAAATDLLRVRDWNEGKGASFLYFGLSTFVSGRCETAR